MDRTPQRTRKAADACTPHSQRSTRHRGKEQESCEQADQAAQKEKQLSAERDEAVARLAGGHTEKASTELDAPTTLQNLKKAEDGQVQSAECLAFMKKTMPLAEFESKGDAAVAKFKETCGVDSCDPDAFVPEVKIMQSLSSSSSGEDNGKGGSQIPTLEKFDNTNKDDLFGDEGVIKTQVTEGTGSKTPKAGDEVLISVKAEQEDGTLIEDKTDLQHVMGSGSLSVAKKACEQTLGGMKLFEEAQEAGAELKFHWLLSGMDAGGQWKSAATKWMRKQAALAETPIGKVAAAAVSFLISGAPEGTWLELVFGNVSVILRRGNRLYFRQHGGAYLEGVLTTQPRVLPTNVVPRETTGQWAMSDMTCFASLLHFQALQEAETRLQGLHGGDKTRTARRIEQAHRLLDQIATGTGLGSPSCLTASSLRAREAEVYLVEAKHVVDMLQPMSSMGCVQQAVRLLKLAVSTGGNMPGLLCLVRRLDLFLATKFGGHGNPNLAKEMRHQFPFM